MREKVIAYVVRRRAQRIQLLVFDHVGMPEAGTQVPAGTVNPCETPVEAVLREVSEEVGVADPEVVAYLGQYCYFSAGRHEHHLRHVFLLTPPAPLPESWTITVGGDGEDRGLLFHCFWIDVAYAAAALAGEQGLYLDPARCAELLPPSVHRRTTMSPLPSSVYRVGVLL
ncbi:ADP-ribose pyrophosphatase YjhB (NUDIX family) [Symbiobacterium terraclitae]|uniref:ADP-ribose pyrophosphatase YjhB (NUDIX family) n=1 Tax=Symbiobacterium terraclitae TaxID=557451 RepID=A0ABS4JQ19_9FIRM|nr:ADP-ribose pyrophosphatase YjhB (NUDIX family) [Symbiobacterium terraclitae]